MATKKVGTILVDVKNKKIGLVYRDALDDDAQSEKTFEEHEVEKLL